MEDKAIIAQEIVRCLGELQSTDYKAIKFAEGLISAEEYAPIKEARQELRNRINELEKQLAEFVA